MSTSRLSGRRLNVHYGCPHDGGTDLAVDVVFEEISLSLESDVTMTEGNET